MVNNNQFNENEISKSPDLENSESSLLSLVTRSYQAKKLTEALDYLTKLTTYFPLKPEYFSGMAIIQKELGNYKEAEKDYNKALEINPGFYEGYYNLGILVYEQGNIDEAIKYFWKAIEIKPDLYLAYYNLGNSYREKKEFNLSLDCYKKAIILRKDFDDAHYNLGVVFEKKRELTKAIECYENAIHYNSQNLSAYWNLALLCLQTGNFSKGWALYEVKKDRSKSGKRIFSKPKLTSESVNSKKIFVYSEQGLGDSIQFARYLKILKNRGAYIIFECKPQLLELFKNLDGIDVLIPEHSCEEKNIEYDYHISLLSLPLYFNTTLETIPSEISYLKANPDKVLEWEKRIKNGKFINIGIAWSGAGANITGKDRSCTLNDFSPLFSIYGIKLFSIQKLESKEEKISSTFPVISFDNLDSIPFLDTAAIIENLDLVISIDTSIVHLAGALGKPVWTLLPYYSDWRWLLDRKDSPWYPTMKLFRQPEPGDWNKVFLAVADEIKKMLILKSQNMGLL